MPDTNARRSYLVECYWPSVDVQKVAAVTRRTRAAAGALQREGSDVQFLWSVLVPSEETVFYFFDGDEAAVRAASEQAGVRVERVLESLHIDGAPDAEENG